MASPYLDRTGGQMSAESFAPLTEGSKDVFFFGLSLADQSDDPNYVAASGSGEIRKHASKGPLNHLKRLTLGGFQMPYKGGKSGDTVTGTLNRLAPEMIAKNPRGGLGIYINGGNDINSVSNYTEADDQLVIMKRDFLATMRNCQASQIRPMVISLPVNGLWTAAPYARWLQDYWEQYLQEWCTQNKITFMSSGAQVARPDTQNLKTVTAGSNVSTAVTLTSNSHGYVVGDQVFVVVAPGGGQNQSWSTANGMGGPGGATITAVTSNTFTMTYNVAPSGAFGSTATTVQRASTKTELMSDKLTHWNAAAARKLALMLLPTFKTMFPPVDRLSNSEMDFYNLVGVGTTIDDKQQVNRGMMLGSGGTVSGTPTPTGTIPKGWTLNGVSGSATSITSSIVAYDDAGFDQYSWWQVAVVTAGSEAIVDMKITSALPSNWSASASKTALSSWVKPTTQNGYWYVCTTSGTTGSTQPTWPTRPGETVTDNNVVWECRVGYQPGVTEMYACADYEIYDMSDQAVVCNSFQIFDDTTSSKSIADFDDGTEAEIPQYFVGERGRYQTPSAVCDASTTSLTIRSRLRIAANSNVTFRLGRVTWRSALV